MQDRKCERAFVVVRDVVYRTFPSGQVVPLMVLDSPITIKVDEKNTAIFEAIKIDDYKTINKFKIQRGQTVKIEVSFTNMDDIDIQIVSGYITFNQPEPLKYCPVCSSNVKHMSDGTLFCTGPLCKAKSTTYIKTLIILCTESGIDHVYPYLDKYIKEFPTYDGDVTLSNVIDFVRLFKSLGNKNIQGRYDLVTKNFPAEMFAFELGLEEKINTGYFRDNLASFWELTGINIKNPINPTMEGVSNAIHFSEESDFVKQEIAENLTNIVNLFNELTVIN